MSIRRIEDVVVDHKIPDCSRPMRYGEYPITHLRCMYANVLSST